MHGPFTPERRFWLVVGLLEAFNLDLTEADFTKPEVSWLLSKATRLKLTGLPDTPLLMVFHQDQLFASILVEDPVDISVQLHLTVHQPGDFPTLEAFEETWQLLKRLLKVGHQLNKARAAG
ncbi:MAG: hypothetical protein INF43_04390 [Alphaproteobacteria bacterium]|nr:hypothetical protein [Alphaproteobacteria bacterium]